MKTILFLAVLSFVFGYVVRHFVISEPMLADGVKASSSDVANNSGQIVSSESKGEWFEKDYAGDWKSFLAMVRDLPKEESLSKRSHAFLQNLSDSDRVSFIQALLEEKARSEIAEQYLRMTLQELAASDPSLATSVFSSMTSSDQQKYRLGFFLHLANNDPFYAWNWAQENPPSNTSRILSEHLNLVSSMARQKSGHAAALDLISALPDIQNRDRLTNFFVSQLARQDLETVISLAEERPQLTELAMTKAMSELAKEEPSMAAELLLENPDFASSESVAEVSRNLLIQDGMEAFESFYAAVTEPLLRDHMALEASRRMASRDLDTAIGWANEIENEQVRNRVGMSVLSEIGFLDNMDEHLRFIEETLGDTADARRSTYLYSLTEWQKVYPDRVRNYVASMEDRGDGVKQVIIERLKL